MQHLSAEHWFLRWKVSAGVVLSAFLRELERPLIMQSSQNGDVLSLVALQDQVEQARHDGDHRVEQELQLLLAREWCQRKQFDRAMEAFGAAYVLSMRTHDERSLLLALLGMSRLYLRGR